MSALITDPPPERGVGRVSLRHEAVAGLYLVFAQLLKSCGPISLGCPPVESNTLERSNTFRCHGTCLSFLIPPVFDALSGNPDPELGVGGVPLWHEAVTELYLVFTQLSKLVAPLRVSNSLIISSFKIRCIDTWLVLVLALTRGSLMRLVFRLIFVTLAHGKC